MLAPEDQLPSGMPDVDDFNSDVQRKKKKKRKHKGKDASSVSSQEASGCTVTEPLEVTHISKQAERQEEHEAGPSADHALQICNWIASQDLSEDSSVSAKKKKRKQRNKHEEHATLVSDDAVSLHVASELVDPIQASSPKKKKRKQGITQEEVIPFSGPTVVSADTSGTEQPREEPKTSVKKSRVERHEEAGPSANVHSIGAWVGSQDLFDSEEERHCRGQSAHAEQVSDSPVRESHKSSKKHKKQKKKEEHSECGEASGSEAILDSSLNEFDVSKKHRKKKKKKEKENGEASISEPILDSPLDAVHKSPKKHKKKKTEKENGEASISEPILDSPLDAVYKSPKKHKKKKKEKQDDENREASLSEAISDSPLNEFYESADRHKKKKRKLYSEHEGYSSELIFESPSRESSKKLKKNKKDQENDGGSDFSVPNDSDSDCLDGRDSSVDQTASHEDNQHAEVTQENNSSHSSQRGSSEISIRSGSSENNGPMENSDSNSTNADDSEERRRETILQPGDTTTVNTTKHEEKKHEGESSTVGDGKTSVTSEDAVTVNERCPTPKTDLDEDKTSDTLCYICEKAMGSKGEYIQHLAEKHGKLSYRCPRCSRPLSSKKMVKHHLQASCVYKQSGDSNFTPFHCHTCPMSYAFSSNLKRHLRTEHKEGKPVEVRCACCNKAFTTAKKATEHEQRCREGHVPKPEGDKVFQCSYCNKMFASRSSCSHHIRGIHKKHVFDCVCGKQFRGSSHYYSHRNVCSKLKEMETLSGRVL